MTACIKALHELPGCDWPVGWQIAFAVACVLVVFAFGWWVDR